MSKDQCMTCGATKFSHYDGVKCPVGTHGLFSKRETYSPVKVRTIKTTMGFDCEYALLSDVEHLLAQLSAHKELISMLCYRFAIKNQWDAGRLRANILAERYLKHAMNGQLHNPDIAKPVTEVSPYQTPQSFPSAGTEWISVKDRLPATGLWVITWDGAYISMAGVVEERWESYHDFDIDPSKTNYVNIPTHWMPLPEPPK